MALFATDSSTMYIAMLNKFQYDADHTSGYRVGKGAGELSSLLSACICLGCCLAKFNLIVIVIVKRGLSSGVRPFLQELRRYIDYFKQSGKFAISYMYTGGRSNRAL